MGKRYYCDFCDRSFADSANNRKNHFKGVNHQRLRKLHYDSFKGKSGRLINIACGCKFRVVPVFGKSVFLFEFDKILSQPSPSGANLHGL